MADNKLNLLVRFTGVDKLSGGLRNIIGASKSGTASIRALQDQARTLKQELKAVGRDMAGASGSVTNLVNRENDLERQLADVNRQIDAQKTKLTRIANIEKRFGGIAATAGKIGGVASVAVTAPLVAFGQHAFKAAMDAEELKSAFNVTFGSNAATMQAWAAKTGNLLDRTQVEMMQAAKTFGVFFKEADPKNMAQLSQQMTVLAQDLSSFHNVNPGVALDKLRAGLTGESEPLRDFGIMMNDAAVKAQALKMGLKPVNGELTEQQKILARSAFIMANAKDANGDLIRTSGSTANQLRAAQTAWTNLSLAIGQDLVPALTPAIKMFTGMIKSFSAMNPETRKWVVILGAAAAVIGPVLVGVAGIAGAIGTLAPVVVAIGGAFSAALPIIGGALTAIVAAVGWPVILIGAAIAGLAALVYANWETIKAWFNAGVAAVKGAIGALPAWLGSIGRTAAAALLGPFGMIAALVSSNWGRISGAFSAGVTAVKGAIGALPTWLGTIGRTAAAALLGPFGMIAALVSANWGRISGAFNAGVAAVKGAIGALPSYLTSIGKTMMNGLLLAINPMALAAKLIGMAKNGITAFKNYLGIKSPSRLMMQMGGHITSGLGMGIDGGRGGPVRAMGRMAGAVAGAGALSLSPAAAQSPAAAGAAIAAPAPVTINVYQQPGEDANALAERVAQLVERAQQSRGRRSFGDDY